MHPIDNGIRKPSKIDIVDGLTTARILGRGGGGGGGFSTLAKTFNSLIDKSYPHFRDFSLFSTYKLKSSAPIYPSRVDGGVVIIVMPRTPMRNDRVSLLLTIPIKTNVISTTYD